MLLNSIVMKEIYQFWKLVDVDINFELVLLARMQDILYIYA